MKTHWCIVVAPDHMVCTRCDRREKIPFPMGITEFVKLSEGFCLTHSDCPVPVRGAVVRGTDGSPEKMGFSSR